MDEYTTEEINQRFALLDQHERRCIVHFLQDADTNHASINELITHLQGLEPTPDDRDTLTMTLQHNHLPKLGTIDAFDFDPRSEMVRYDGDNLLETLLEPVAEPLNANS